jgi:hypothetical protein
MHLCSKVKWSLKFPQSKWKLKLVEFFFVKLPSIKIYRDRFILYRIISCVRAVGRSSLNRRSAWLRTHVKVNLLSKYKLYLFNRIMNTVYFSVYQLILPWTYLSLFVLAIQYNPDKRVAQACPVESRFHCSLINVWVTLEDLKTQIRLWWVVFITVWLWGQESDMVPKERHICTRVSFYLEQIIGYIYVIHVGWSFNRRVYYKWNWRFVRIISPLKKKNNNCSVVSTYQGIYI